MDIEFNRDGHSSNNRQSIKGSRRNNQSLWFEEPSETLQKLNAYYRQCNTLEFGLRSKPKDQAKVSIDSSIFLPEIKEKSSIVKDIKGKKVLFPMEPYDQQKEYVGNLISALNQAQSTLLEYPRGGGRTLALLAGCLSWLFEKSEAKDFPLPKVFFVCRNFSRLPDVLCINKIISQVKKEVYKYSITVLGSRDQLCVNPNLSDCHGKERISRCKNLVQNKECRFFNTYAEKRDLISNLYKSKVMDIEEWTSEGKSQKFCPFYATRNLVDQAHLVMLPYELLLDPKYIDLIHDHYENSVLIIEDADLFEGFALEVIKVHLE